MAEYPRFQPTLTPPDNPACHGDIAHFCHPDTLGAAITSAVEKYDIEPKHAAQLWWFSWCNSTVSASVTAMVEFYKIPSLDLEQGQIFHVEESGHPDPYWCGFLPADLISAQQVETFLTGLQPNSPTQQALAELSATIDDPDDLAELHACAASAHAMTAGASRIIAAIGASFEVKPAPLWAVLGDAFVTHAVAVGNDSFDPARGVAIARALNAGLAEHVPSPRFDIIRDGHLLDRGEHDKARAGDCGIDDDDHVVAKRSSCCMIYHSPRAGKCLSCPKQLPQDREEKLLNYVASL
ncbi:(2Fe-2S)-binding protein [Corynebacterium aquilae]|uniref:(2Fe-2S)-binding protein n=1 Tax=Corynebacterium aquilae TaxID=203263 RepID=UPI0012EE4E13|nr:(2Fe-2S)-binding protein [Corynebacterium aquilae]